MPLVPLSSRWLCEGADLGKRRGVAQRGQRCRCQHLLEGVPPIPESTWGRGDLREVFSDRAVTMRPAPRIPPLEERGRKRTSGRNKEACRALIKALTLAFKPALIFTAVG